MTADREELRKAAFEEAARSGFILEECGRCHAWRMVRIGMVKICTACWHETPGVP